MAQDETSAEHVGKTLEGPVTKDCRKPKDTQDDESFQTVEQRSSFPLFDLCHES